MKKHKEKLWFTITVILSIIFALLFYNVAIENVRDSDATIYTILGVLVIWIVYFVRGYIFSKLKKKE